MSDDTTIDGIRRRRLLQTTGAGMAAGLAGCVGGLPGGGGGGGPTVLTYGDRSDNSAPYAHTYDNSTETVNLKFTVTDGRYRDIIPKVKAGQSIQDILGVDIVQLPKLAELGALRDITDFFNSLDYKGDFLGQVDPMYTTWGDTKYAVPYWLDLSLVYYNKKHFEQAGLDPESPPTTWSGFRSALETIDSELDLNRPPLGASFASGLSEFFFLPFVWSAGGGWFEGNDYSKTIIDGEGGVKALDYWTGINEGGLATDLIATEWMDWHNMFVDEQISVMFSGGFGLGHVRKNNEEMFNDYLGTTMFPAPQGRQRSTFLGGNSLSITASAPDDEIDEAEEFVRWVNTEEGMKVTLEIGYMPGRKRGFDIGLAAGEPFNTLLKPFEQGLNQGKVPLHPKFEEISLPIRSAVQQALSGKSSPQGALTQAAGKINNDVLSG